MDQRFDIAGLLGQSLTVGCLGASEVTRLFERMAELDAKRGYGWRQISRLGERCGDREPIACLARRASTIHQQPGEVKRRVGFSWRQSEGTPVGTLRFVEAPYLLQGMPKLRPQGSELWREFHSFGQHAGGNGPLPALTHCDSVEGKDVCKM